MISDDELRELHFMTNPPRKGASQQNPMLRYGKGTEIEDCECEETCSCDPCPCDTCEECEFCLCCCVCDEEEDDSSDESEEFEDQDEGEEE
jgi:hypothetical protein